MSKTYLPYEPAQQLLLPAALQEWLPDDHLAYFIFDVVDQLDMSEVTARYERERRGGPPYHPRMMVKVLLYGYCVGVASSRRIAQRLHEDIAFRVLAANNTPDFRTISDFRKDNVDALSGLFVQVLALCQQAGLVKLGHVALDGTKVKANASKHKAMSYQRMKEKAAQLAAEVAKLLRQAQAADDEEDRRYGKDKRGDELPQELAFREGRLEKIREAMAALEAEAQAAGEQAEAEGGKHPGVPDDKAQRNFTDTESRIIPAPGGKDFLQAYNRQAVVDSAHQVIVAAPPLTASAHDVPASHDGSAAFTFELHFSETPNDGFSYKTLRDHAFTVMGGEVVKARRLEQGKSVRWEITVRPSSNADVTIVLPITTDCAAQGAICTSDGRKLSSRVELTIRGPNG